ncbi:hypothetical protein EJ357_41325 [Streptomyces cyaneochromogenes]|uniref:YopA central domain-containing protein n=1 Tax=Streptomyces cyaneochromogenes TaxID=2496836 RepID=A0A3S9MIR0_9ACTN|nr:hypothetical protein [Streptomyces cyaneochromogenes]AZQ39086.1 hypothetical protein EJ357_41325 [Streptomyces cyaneochromogenes]
MATTNEPPACQPLTPVYPYNEPGQPVLLHDGPIGGLGATDVHGRVELTCSNGLSFEWEVGDGTSPGFANRDEVLLILHRPMGDMVMSGVPRNIDGGWSNGAVFGDSQAPLTRILVHWFNLPNWHGPLRLAEKMANGEREWSGRWQHQASGWKITLDVRPDYQRVWQGLYVTDVYVMTHVMEVSRADDAVFTADEASHLLTAMHVGISFALGRWAAPMLPVGEDSDGCGVWEEWLGSHCDPARRTSDGWWYDQDHESLGDFLSLVIKDFADPDRLVPLRFEMMYAISATGSRDFVEPRIIMGTAGLEHIMWQSLVLGGALTKQQYKQRPAHDLLRRVLRGAHIPVDINPRHLPAAAQYAADVKAKENENIDGADVVTWVRNRLVHPQESQEPVYRLDGLTRDAWLLARHYLVLLILSSVGYNGKYRDLTRIRGWVGDVSLVPWA